LRWRQGPFISFARRQGASCQIRHLLCKSSLLGGDVESRLNSLKRGSRRICDGHGCGEGTLPALGRLNCTISVTWVATLNGRCFPSGVKDARPDRCGRTHEQIIDNMTTASWEGDQLGLKEEASNLLRDVVIPELDRYRIGAVTVGGPNHPGYLPFFGRSYASFELKKC